MISKEIKEIFEIVSEAISKWKKFYGLAYMDIYTAIEEDIIKRDFEKLLFDVAYFQMKVERDVCITKEVYEAMNKAREMLENILVKGGEKND